MGINRDKSRQPSKKLFYCGCDYDLVGHSGKCGVCGASYKGTKERKPFPTTVDQDD